MKANLTLITILLLCFFQEFFSASIDKGIATLSNTEIESGLIDLQGELFFFHEQLLKEVSNEKLNEASYIMTTNSWNNQPEGYNNYEAINFGTYYFQIKVPKEYVGSSFILRPKHFIAYASEVYINGERCARSGSVGGSVDDIDYKPSRESASCSFIADSTKIDVAIQVANFHHFRGGIFKPIAFGLEPTIRVWRERSITWDLLVIVSLLIMSVYHLVMYSVYRKQKISVSFSLVCLVFAIDLSFQGPMCFFLFFPSAPFALYSVLHLITPYLIPAVFILFFKSLFPKYVSPKIIILSIALALVFLLTTIFGTIPMRSYVIKPNYIYALFLILYVFNVAIKLLNDRVLGAKLFMGSFSLFALCALNDILNMFELIQSVNVLSYGIVSFVFLLSVIYGKQTSRSHDEILELSEDLKNLNQQLENKVAARTQQLNNSLVDLNKLNNFQEGMTHLIAHDLKNPLMQILNIEYVREKDYPALKNSGYRMLNMIQNMLDLYRFNNNRVKLRKSSFDINNAIDSIISEFSFISQKKSIKIELIQHRELVLNADVQIFNRVLTNFLSNAFKYSPSGGLVQIIVSKENDNYLKVEVNNEGPLIAKNVLDNIFDSKTQSAVDDSNKSSGLGLYLSKMAVDIQQGRIGVSSKEGDKVRFWFTLPGLEFSTDGTTTKLIDFDVDFQLQSEEIDYLRPYVDEISKYEVFESTNIELVLSKIEHPSKGVKKWVMSIEKACYSVDDALLEKMINFVRSK